MWSGFSFFAEQILLTKRLWRISHSKITDTVPMIEDPIEKMRLMCLALTL